MDKHDLLLYFVFDLHFYSSIFFSLLLSSVLRTGSVARSGWAAGREDTDVLHILVEKS